jgi:hypothetical protein
MFAPAADAAWQEFRPARHWLYGNDTDVLSQISGMRADALPPSVGNCTVQRHSRVCRCSSGFAFNSDSPTFASHSLRAALSRETELLHYFRDVCFWDTPTVSLLTSLLCALEQRPCSGPATGVNDSVVAAKLCRSDCVAAGAAVERRLTLLTGVIDLVLKQQVASGVSVAADVAAAIVAKVVGDCRAMWTDFVDCGNSDLFSDDASCVPSVPSTVEPLSRVYQMRARECSRLQDRLAGQPACRPEAKFSEAKCSSGRAATMRNGVLAAEFSAETGSIQFRDLASNEVLAFTLLGFAQVEEERELRLTVGAERRSLADIKPVLTCGDAVVGGEHRFVNVTWPVTSTSKITLVTELVDKARRTTFNYTVPANTIKISIVVDGNPFGALRQSASNFSFDVALDMAPFAGIFPSLEYASFFLAYDECVQSQTGKIENAFAGQFTYAMPKTATFDGKLQICRAFELGMGLFADTAALFANRRCPRVQFELRLPPFKNSLELDPTLEVVAGGETTDAERERYKNELESLYNEADVAPDDDSLSSGAVAAIVIVVIVLIVGGLVGLFIFLKRTGRLDDAIAERKSAK